MSTWFVTLLQVILFSGSPEGYRPSWRGPDTTGAVANAALPVSWSENEHIRWKAALPGFGLATPIIWGDRLFVLTAAKTERKAEKVMETDPRMSWAKPIVPDQYYQFRVIALDRETGKVLWDRAAVEKVPHETTHGDASWASSSPVTDGTHLVASFGSAGIFCYDMEGNLQWQVALGEMRTRRGFGEGASPALHGDTVIINWDHEDQSFIVALDKRTGKQRWKVDRDEPTSWSTPAVAEVDGKPQVVVSATNKIRGYDLATGSLIWECGGMTVNTIPSPIVEGTTIYVASGYRGNSLMAIDLAGARGDITGSRHVIWRHERDTPYVPSMLLYGGALYFIKHNQPIISCFDVETGKAHYGPERLEEIRGVYASPVGAGDHVYIVGRSGTTVVLKKGPKFEVAAVNKLDDRFDASPAIAENLLYLRGHKHLYCIGK